MPIEISYTTKNKPKGHFALIAEAILGKKYNLSLVFIGSTKAKQLNQQTRQKDYVPNVLSFPLDKTTGEIFICPEVAKKEAKNFNLTPAAYLEYLCIHGCLHLLGYDHSPQMDKLEDKYKKLFNLN